MPSDRVTCPECKKVFPVRGADADGPLTCPRCGAVLELEPVAPPEPTPAEEGEDEDAWESQWTIHSPLPLVAVLGVAQLTVAVLLGYFAYDNHLRLGPAPATTAAAR